MQWNEIDLTSLEEDYGPQYGPQITEAVYDLLEAFDHRFTLLGVGRNRAVFMARSGKYVIKVPTNGRGFMDNQNEARISQEHPNSIFARAKLHNIMPVGIPVLFMEYVEPVHLPYRELPDWVMGIDCGQVGLDRAGNLKAYDYAECF